MYQINSQLMYIQVMIIPNDMDIDHNNNKFHREYNIGLQFITCFTLNMS